MSARTRTREEKPRQAPDPVAPLGNVLREQDSRRVDLAQRLHRDVAGGLVACTTMSEMIRHELGQSADGEALSGMLANLESALRQTIKVVRDLTGEQLPSVLKTFGIAGALRQLAAEPRSSIELTVAGDEPDLDLSERLCLHQIIQALLQRIRRHAGATRIELVAMFESHRMEILFEHDGSDVLRALTPDDAALVAIKGRISLLSGRLLFSRSAGEGPRRVRLVIPLPVHSGEISPPTSQSTELP